jgi:arylsulfatase A-like enzyme
MRYVLALPSPTLLHLEPGERHELRATEQGTIELSVPCPDPLRDRDILAYIGRPDQAHEQVIHCPAAAGAPLALRFGGFEPAEKVLGVVLARALPVNHIETGVHRVGPRATLELAIGDVAPEPRERSTPSWVRITAQGSDGRAERLLDRTLDPAARPADRGWVDLQIPLDAARAALGSDLRFIFESGSDEGSMRPGLPVWADPTIFEPDGESRESAPWNVLLVSIDTLRPDRLGVYGARRPTSPVLDGLAAAGTVFDVAIAPAPWTLPSHATMLTGLYGCVHGAVEGIASRLTPGVIPLAGMLRAAGYTTVAFTEDGFVLPGIFSAGFGRYQQYGNSFEAQIERTVGAAVDWLRDNPSQPFFLFLHTYQTHSPYYAPPPYASMFGGPSDPSGASGMPKAPSREEKLAQYDRSIRYADSVLGQLFSELDHLGLADRTLVVVTSDHGEAFGEHGYYGHGRTMHDEVLRVPLLFRAPGLVAARRRVSGMVGVIDLAPTLLDLLSIEPPYPLQGISLASLMRPGAAPIRAPSRVLFSENELQYRRVAARSDQWAIQFDGETVEVFDLAADPGEQEPRPPATLAVVPEVVRRSFDEECARVRARLAPGAPSPTTLQPALPDPDQERRLKALGYVD